MPTPFTLPADGWSQIEVPGEHINHEAKVVQVIDAEAVQSICNRFAAEAAQPNFAGILIDYDHFSLDGSKTSEAAGWAMELRNRAGVPEARIRWTASGEPRIAGGDFRFFSTVYQPHQCEDLGTRIVNGEQYRVLRPLRLDRLAVTNDPNNKGARPITNRSPGGDSANSNQNQTMNPDLLKELGLPPTATAEEALAAVRALKGKVTAADTSVAEIKNRADALAAENKQLLADAVEADLDKHSAVIANRENVKAQLLANRKGTLAVLAALKPATPPTAPAAITNRATAKTPQAQADAADKDAKRDAAVNDYRIKNRCGHEEAWAAVRETHSELF